MGRAKILTLEELQTVRRALAEAGQTLVQCHGCFDIVHPGHVRYLRFAAEQGDKLLVSVSGDAVVAKGIDRPYIHEELRMENLAALECVDYVVLDGHTWAGPILEAVQPDIYVKGREYETNRDPRFLRERALVEEYGGRVIFGSGDVVFSSTAIIRRYREKFDLDRERVDFYCKRHGLTRPRLDEVLQATHGRKVAVLADPLLDVYVHGSRTEVASEAPILSVTPESEERFAGGGALIAGQLAALGAEVQLVTVLSEGPDATAFREEVERRGIELVVVPSARRPTYVKTRYLVDGQKVFKVDRGHRSELATTEVEALIAELSTRLPALDALVVTDFGYGLVGAPLAEALTRLTAETATPWFADVSGGQRTSILKFQQPTLAAPTENELRFAFGDRESGLSHLALEYFRRTGARGLVLTMGSRGAVRFRPPQDGATRLETDFLPALDAANTDAVGAGDVFLAGLVAGHLAGDDALALYLGTALAAEHVGRLGNAPVPLLALTEALDRRPELA